MCLRITICLHRCYDDVELVNTTRCQVVHFYFKLFCFHSLFNTELRSKLIFLYLYYFFVDLRVIISVCYQINPVFW